MQLNKSLDHLSQFGLRVEKHELQNTFDILHRFQQSIAMVSMSDHYQWTYPKPKHLMKEELSKWRHNILM